MGKAKQLIVKPISAQDANRIIKSLHYSGKVVPNSKLHFGVFLNGKCGGAMSFGSCINKKGTINLVKETGWNSFIELNRMAFADWLPRFSESRCIAYTMRFIKKHYPHIDWVISFADGTQCGDGTIYRASGFDLVGITKNAGICKLNGKVVHIKKTYDLGLTSSFLKKSDIPKLKKKNINVEILEGFQLKYIYFIDKTARKRLTVPILPYSEIDKRGAGMYKGQTKCVVSDTSDTANFQLDKGGATPTTAHQ